MSQIKVASTASFVSVILLLCAARAESASLTLQWDSSTSSDIAGYLLSWGTRSGVYDHAMDVGNQTTQVVPGLAPVQARLRLGV